MRVPTSFWSDSGNRKTWELPFFPAGHRLFLGSFCFGFCRFFSRPWRIQAFGEPKKRCCFLQTSSLPFRQNGSTAEILPRIRLSRLQATAREHPKIRWLINHLATSVFFDRGSGRSGRILAFGIKLGHEQVFLSDVSKNTLAKKRSCML